MTDKILRKIGDLCGPAGGFNPESVGIRAVVKELELGAASSFPPNAFRDQLFGCAKSNQKWRVVIALFQFYETAQEQKFQNLVGNFTRIKFLGNGKFVSAQDSGNNPLAANRDRVDIWEQFLVLHNPEDGTISLRARANGKLVTTDLNIGARLIARSETVQQWEKFDMDLDTTKGGVGSTTATLKARANGRYVAVDLAGNAILVAERERADEAAVFEFSSALSGLTKAEVLGFPIVDDSPGGVRIPLVILVFASIGSLLLVLALTVMCILMFLYMYKLRGNSSVQGSFGLQVQAFWFLRVRKGLDRMLESTAVDNEYLLYSGPNSRVYLGRYRMAREEVRQVAVKIPSKEAFRMDMIIEETRINAQLRHERIVEYIGYFRDAFGDMRIVSEFMQGGDLHSHLANRKNPLTTGHLFNFLGQIAEGMEYLAFKRIIHRDLAARNCMLTADCTAIKIADFGLSRHFNLDANYTSTSPVRLPIRWTAVECLGQNADILPNAKFSEKSDIWSFGIVLWECFTRGEMPYGAEEVQEVLGRLRAGWRLPQPEHCPPVLYEKLALKCWHARPELRPDFALVRQLIEDIFGELVGEEPECICREIK